jgi:hypothetical protein
MRDRIDEAPLRAEDAGRVPEGDGDVARASGIASDRFGSAAVFEGREGSDRPARRPADIAW